MTYHLSAAVPHVDEKKIGDHQPLVLHISSFNFTPKASMKPPPGESVAVALAEEILNDGFITAGDVLRITVMQTYNVLTQPLQSEEANKLLPQSVGYTKAQARVTTLLCLASIFIDDRADMLLAPPLSQTNMKHT